jgi:hypothetical protein
VAKATRAQLLAAVGGRPTVVQQQLIDMAVQLRLRLACAERAFAAADNASRGDDYPHMSAAYAQLLQQLEATRTSSNRLTEQLNQLPAAAAA